MNSSADREIDVIINIIKKYVPPGSEVGRDTNYIVKFDIDSLKFVELLEEIECYYKISLLEYVNDLTKIDTPKGICEVVTGVSGI